MPIFNFLSRYTGSRELAKELIQETFIRLWQAAHTFNAEGGNFKGWIYTVALNLARDEMSKKRYTYRFIPPEELYNPGEYEKSPTTPGPDKLLEQQDTRESIAKALGRLPALQREVIIMKNYQHLKFREIAQVTRTPESTLKARYHRAITRLKELLLPEEVNPYA